MKKVLFETHHLYYLPNFLPVIKELKNRGDYIIHLSMPKRKIVGEEKTLNKACSDLNLIFLSGENENERIKKIIREAYDIIIVGNVGQLKQIVLPNTLAVMVYHGIGLKQSYYRDIDERIDIRSVESKERLIELEGQGHNNLVLTGFTKLDRLYSINKNTVKLIKQDLNLNTNKKTILYAPSFYPTSIEKLCSQLSILSRDYNIIIKLHSFSWEQKRFLYQSIMCIELAEKFDGIKLLSKDIYDILYYYIIADILISDISSTIFEFLPLNKPIIQAECFSLRLKHKIFHHRFLRKLDIQRMQNIDFAYKIQDPADLIGRIQFALDYPDEMSSLRKIAHEQYLYKKDGKASLRLVNAIEEKIK
ncbi:MAG: hypothetical protein CMG74_11315 [Candidatus Marinimicrobia bacterium]|nr:hypothetical protein [Candidatus Neomarinimicrobiota bacterium]|tara:strand:- start:25474 stop:26559 length:1086 start_codon:yes stop_codon:yes gene_type:complete